MAAIPIPSVNPALLCPAIVVTAPAELIFLTRPLFMSAKNTVPDESTATPTGPLSRAALPIPSANAAVLLPAKVVTTAAELIFLMRLFEKSATYRFPEVSALI